MAGLFDYTNSNIPAEAFLFRQGSALPPDVAQMATANQSPSQVSAQQTPSGIPAYLTPNPMAPKDATPSGLDAYLHMNQAVKAYNPQSVSRPNPTISDYGRMANTAAAEQWAGIDQIQKYIEDLKGQPQGINYSPLAAYIDAQDPSGKSHLTQMAEAMAPMTPDQKQKMITDLQLKLQGDRNDISKGQLAALGQQIQMQHNAEMMQHLMNEDRMNAQRGNYYAAMGGVKQDQLGDQAVQHVTTDKQLNTYMPRIDAANRILAQLQDVRAGRMVDTNQFLGDLNSEYVNLLTNSNNTALGKQERTEYTTAAGKLANVLQTLKAQPESINSPQILQQIETGVRNLETTYRQNFDARAQALQRNYPHNPNATQQQAQKIDELRQLYGTKSQSPIGLSWQNLSNDDVAKLYNEHIRKP